MGLAVVAGCRSRGAEVQAMFAELRNRQEQYHFEDGVYFSTGADESAIHPATPGPQSHVVTQLSAAPATDWYYLLARP